MPISDFDLLRLQVEALFTHDPDGRIRWSIELTRVGGRFRDAAGVPWQRLRGRGCDGRGGLRTIARKQPAAAARTSLDATARMMHAAQRHAAVVAALGKPAKRGKAAFLPIRNGSVDFTFQGPWPADARVGGLHVAVTMCADSHYVLFMRTC